MERPAHVVLALHVIRRAIDHDDEDAPGGIGGEVVGILLRARVLALAVRGPGVEGDEFGALDRLERAVFVDLEVVLRQAFDDLAIFADGIGVDAHIVRAGAENWRPRLLWLRCLRNAEQGCHDGSTEYRPHDNCKLQTAYGELTANCELRTAYCFPPLFESDR
jgi:hypothetical protein